MQNLTRVCVLCGLLHSEGVLALQGATWVQSQPSHLAVTFNKYVPSA